MIKIRTVGTQGAADWKETQEDTLVDGIVPKFSWDTIM